MASTNVIGLADGQQPLPQDLAHIPFFANLPAELRAMCCEEGYELCNISREKVLYNQGSAVEESDGLYVILKGEVCLHARDAHVFMRVDSHQGSRAAEDVGSERLRLGVGEAFGDEILHLELFRGSAKRSTSAVVPAAAICMLLRSKRLLGALADFIGQQKSAFYFLHPLLCLQALRVAPEKRGRTEDLRIAQCLDGLGLFGKKYALAHTLSFHEVERGQVVFLEADRIEACYFVVYGEVLLSQHGASPDPTQPANPCPPLGHVVDELCAGDVLIDPAPWFHGVWPCSAVASTKSGIIRIPRVAVEDLKSQGVFVNPRQILKLLRKPADVRTRLDNSRIAHFLSSFKSVRGVPMDKRVEMAQLLTIIEHQPGHVFSPCSQQELLVVSGSVRNVPDDDVDVSRQEDASTIHASSLGVSDEDPASCVAVDTTNSTSHARVQAWVHAAFSVDIAMDISNGRSLESFVEDLESVEEQSQVDDRCNQLLSRLSGLLSAFENAKLASWLETRRRAPNSAMRDASTHADADLLPGDVIGWHIFPCSTHGTGTRRFEVLSPTAFAALAHRDIEGFHAAHIFRRASAYISQRASISLLKALRSPPPRSSPESIADVVAGLQNTPPFSIVRKCKPEAFHHICAQTHLREVAPGEFVRSRGDLVDEIYVVIKGTLENFVIASKTEEDWEDECSWAQREECIAVYGCGDSVGFADMLGEMWTSSLKAGHLGCSLAVVPSELLVSHVDLLMSSLGAAVSPESCRGVLSVPRKFTTSHDLMVLRMLMANSPSFKGLAHDCMDRLFSKVRHRFACPDQLVSVQDDETDTFALVVRGTLGSYCGLSQAVKSVLCPQASAYISPSPFQRVADASSSVRLFWLTDLGGKDQDLELEGLWEERDVEINEEGNLSYTQGRTRVLVGNIRQELTDLEASDWLLKRCSATLTGATEMGVMRPITTSSSLQRVPSAGAMRKMRKQASENGPATEGRAQTKASGPMKVGQAANRIVLRFGSYRVTLWSANSLELEKTFLCAMQHYTQGKDHAIGMLGKITNAEGEVGVDVLHSCRYYSRVRDAPPAPSELHEGRENSRPSTAGQRPSTAQPQPTGQRNLQTIPDVSAEQHSANEVLRNASSVLVLQPSELLVLRKSDVEDAMLELRADQLRAVISSLGDSGVQLARDLNFQDLKVVAACLEACKFEARQTLFAAGQRADEIFVVTKGQCSLMLASPLKHGSRSAETKGLQGRPMPHVRGRKKPKCNVGMSIMHAPCMLGLQKIEPAADGSAVYSLTAEAASSVEALVLRPSEIAARAPELRGRFLDRFAECLKQEAALLNEGSARFRVLPGSTDALMSSRRFAEARVRQSELGSSTGSQEGELPSIGSSSGQMLWDVGHTRKSIRAAAADLGRELRQCLGAGATRKSYHATAQCPSCLRLMYPGESTVCGKCGCDSRGWQSKMAAMSLNADTTMEHLQFTRDRRREQQDFAEMSKFDMMDEQPDANYATVLSRGKDGMVLSLSYQLSSDDTNEERAPSEHHDNEREIHLPSQGEEDAKGEHDNEEHVEHSHGLSHRQTHEAGKEGSVNMSNAGVHSPTSPEWGALKINALRPLSSVGAIHLGNTAEQDDLRHRRQGLRSRDNVRTVARVRPTSSTPGLGNGSGSSAVMAREVGVAARNQRVRSKASADQSAAGVRVRARSECCVPLNPDKIMSNVHLNPFLLQHFQQTSALSNRPATPEINVLDKLYQEERPQTSPSSQRRVHHSRPASSQGIAAPSLRPSSPFVGERQLNILGLSGRSSPPGLSSPPNSSMKTYKEDLESQLTSKVARRYPDAVSSSLILNPAWFLACSSEEEASLGPPRGRGPSAFLVSRATRSQVTLRKSAPKYQRLARLHFDRQGAEF